MHLVNEGVWENCVEGTRQNNSVTSGEGEAKSVYNAFIVSTFSWHIIEDSDWLIKP